MYTASTAFLDALVEAGVSHVFVNYGSDHSALLEALAEARVAGRKVPKMVTAPNEMVGLSAAHAFFQLTGKAQAVIVHVDCGTQALAGAIHNAAKGRAAALIFAGASPFTQEGEHPGSRNEFIQWIQDVSDQRGLVRGYVKYSNEFRSPANVKQIVHRAMQFALTDPKGPVYLVGAREVMEAEAPAYSTRLEHWQPVAPAALPASAVAEIAASLAAARRPLVVTSYVGRKPEAVAELVRLCRRLGVGVLESVPSYMNYPHADPLYQGNQWNSPKQNRELAEADVVLVIDSDVPWIPIVSRPAEQAMIYHIDIDPLKLQMPLWYIPTTGSYAADAATALLQLNEQLDQIPAQPTFVQERTDHYAGRHGERALELSMREQEPDDGAVSPEYLVSCIREVIDDDTVIINEAISNYGVVFDHLKMSRPGSMFASGGGSLGWNGGAAIGAKLARPDQTVIAITGDGSFMFTVPSSVYWMARKYDAPFLQIVLNNRGWKSPVLSLLAVHPDGYASRSEDLDVSFDPSPDYAGIATASGGALGRKVERAGDLKEALAQALHAVREERRCAVLDIWLPALQSCLHEQGTSENIATSLKEFAAE